MTMGKGLFAALGMTLGMGSAAFGQNFNVDFTAGGASAPDTYAAAVSAGHWNPVFPVHGGGAVFLDDLDGNATGVFMSNIGGTALLFDDNPLMSGDDAALMEDYLVTFSGGLETCIFMHGLENGTYELTMYCWLPLQSGVKSFATVDQSAEGGQEIGGVWSGSHGQLLTFSRHIAEVTTGRLDFHSGIVPGANPAEGAALNGFQLRKVVPCAPDLDGDGAVGSGDLAQLLGAWGACPAPLGPAICVGDLDGDSQVTSSDLALMLGSWGSCE